MAINKGSANRVILVGNLGADAEVHQTTDGTPVATLSLATNELWKDNDDKQQEHTEWHRVVLWRKQAEFAGQHLKKGRKIYVEGRLRTRTWEDKDGVKRTTTEVIADSITILAGKSTAEQAPSTEPAVG